MAGTSPLVPKSGETIEEVRAKIIIEQLDKLIKGQDALDCKLDNQANLFAQFQLTYTRAHAETEGKIEDTKRRYEASVADWTKLRNDVDKIDGRVYMTERAIEGIKDLKKAVYWFGGVMGTAAVGLVIGLLTHTIKIP